MLLVENTRTRKRYAVKKITCHSREDQKQAMEEISYHKLFDHPNIIKCLDSSCEGNPDPVINATSEVLLLLPYYAVSFQTDLLHNFSYISTNIWLPVQL